jgi:Dolichyl-phosphate-mannose-protein mannosyltransferase
VDPRVILRSDGARRWLLLLGVASLLLLLILELALTVRQESQTWDEACHIFAGYSYWTRGDFGMNPEHPPLVKLLATLPLLRLPLRVPKLQGRDAKVEAFLDGRDFLYGNNADLILFRTRMAASILTLLLALLVFVATREMFGTSPAFLALVLLVFEPNLLAHGALVTTDMGVTCFLFAAVYLFYRYVKKPSIAKVLMVGLATGFALASKHSAVLLGAILVLLAVFEVVRGPMPAPPLESVAHSLDRESRDRRPSRGKLAARMAASLLAVAVVGVGVLWAFYGFRFQMRPAGLPMNPPLVQFVSRIKHPAEVRALLTLARWRVLPEAYLYGLADVQQVTDSSATYVFGKVYPRGKWFYFPAAFVIKATLPVLLLLLFLPLALHLRRTRKWPNQGWREAAFLVLPPALYLGVAMDSGLNIGLRHILPIFPFVLILAAFAGWTLARSHRPWTYAVAGLLIFHAFSSVRAFPVYLAYSNEAWGGPSKTYKFLTDSNVDWGQQLKATSRYLRQRHISNCWFAYFADVAADPAYYGIPCKPLTTISTMWLQPLSDVPRTIDGTVLVSAGVLSGYELGPGELNPYEQFQKLRPTAVIDDGVFVFTGHFDTSLASALNHVGKVWHLAESGDLDGALAEARAAVATAPNSVRAQASLGDMLMATQHPEDAHLAYQRALALTQTLQPEYRQYWGEILRKDLATR